MQSIIEDLTQENNKLYLVVKVIDSEKAQKLLSTFINEKNINYFGVSVESFSNNDVRQIHKTALQEISKYSDLIKLEIKKAGI